MGKDVFKINEGYYWIKLKAIDEWKLICLRRDLNFYLEGKKIPLEKIEKIYIERVKSPNEIIMFKEHRNFIKWYDAHSKDLQNLVSSSIVKEYMKKIEKIVYLKFTETIKLSQDNSIPSFIILEGVIPASI